jgi:UrcA family protein
MKLSIDQTFLAIVAVAALAIPVLASAEPASTVVRYSAAELATPAGVALVYGRIAAAARAVCAPYSGRELARQQLYSHCYRDALSGGVRRVRNPALNAYYEARTGEHLTGTALKVASEALPSRARNR